jgi:hypothetical protein
VIAAVARLRSLGSAGSSSDKPEPLPVPENRYDPDYWGKAVTQSKGGRSNKAVDQKESFGGVDTWDLVACRKLIVSLNAEDVRRRLEDSPWAQGKAPDSVNWLKEAASAFSVTLKYKQGDNEKVGQYKLKAEIVEQVCKQKL